MDLKAFSKKTVIGGTLLIWLIKYGIRPYAGVQEPLNFLLGIAPNFLGSLLIPFGACWFFGGRDFAVARLFRTRNMAEVRLVCLLGFLLLVVNEYLQKIPLFGRTFDYFDILFSASGLMLAYYVFARKLQQGYTVPG